LIWVYCKTADKPKEVGEYICKSNFGRGDGYVESQVMKDEIEEDCWLIETHPQNETSAMVYRIGNAIVAIEIENDCAVNVIETLMKKYGLADVKWLLTK
jgi:hypothetical protein